jgi:hypothetical protein
VARTNSLVAVVQESRTRSFVSFMVKLLIILGSGLREGVCWWLLHSIAQSGEKMDGVEIAPPPPQHLEAEVHILHA